MKSVYVGIDVSARECAICVKNRRGVIQEEVVIKTSEGNLVSYLESLKGKVVVHLEECDMAGWLARVIAPHVEDVVVSDPHYNSLINGFGNKADPEDARKLADLLRLGAFRRVHHPTNTLMVHFSALVKEQLSLTRRIAGQKNRVKAALRREGIILEGSRLYSKRRRPETLAHLPGPLALVLDAELTILDCMRDEEARIRRAIAELARDLPIVAALDEVPGIGLLLAARFVAIIFTPHRFSGRRQLWKYCRLGIRTCESGGKKIKGDRIDRAGNGTLKDLSRKAFVAAVLNSKAENIFSRYYRRALARGQSEEHARLSTQRLIVSVMWAMWKDGTRFKDRECEEAA